MKSAAAMETASITPLEGVYVEDAPAIPHEAIAERAYAIYNARVESGEPGAPEDDWFKALDELTAE